MSASSLGMSIKNLNYGCSLPFFPQNLYFNADFVNTFIQQKGLEIVSFFRKWIIDLREFIEEEEFHSYIDISYSIKYLTEHFLSISIVSESFLGGPRPSTSFYTLNFKFNPEIELKIGDVIGFQNLVEFVKESIHKYGDQDQKLSLPEYINDIRQETLNFVFE
jgi:hypothetical protein